MIVKVTSKHITAAKKSANESPLTGCVVATALKSKRKLTNVRVGMILAHYDIGDKHFDVQLPEIVSRKIEQFMGWAEGNKNSKRPKPFQFEIPDGD